MRQAGRARLPESGRRIVDSSGCHGLLIAMRNRDYLLSRSSDEIKTTRGWGAFHRGDEERCTWISHSGSCDRGNISVIDTEMMSYSSPGG